MPAFLKPVLFVCFSTLFLLATRTANAHSTDHSYLFLRVTQDSLTARIETEPKLFNQALGLNLSTEVDHDEVAAAAAQIRAYLLKNMSFKSPDGEYRATITAVKARPLDDEADQIAINITFPDMREIPDQFIVNYTPFFTTNHHHVGKLIVEHNWMKGVLNNHHGASATFVPKRTAVSLKLTNGSTWTGIWTMALEGMRNYSRGTDYLAFLLVLALPAVLRHGRKSSLDPTAGGWKPVESFKHGYVDFVGQLLLFTVGWTAGLWLGVMAGVSVLTAVGLAVTALSIAVLAVNNIKPMLGNKVQLLLLVFGLFHGIALSDDLLFLNRIGDFMGLSTLGWNIGTLLELLLISTVLFAVLFLLRKRSFYPRLMQGVSVLVLIVSLLWLSERLFGFNIRLGSLLNSIF